MILAEEPTQGVDVGARFDIYDALREKASDGVSIVVKSSDPLELAGLCDRVVVISRGKIVDEIHGEDLGERRIVEAIVGARAAVAERPAMTFGARVAAVVAGIRFRGVVPLVLMTTLILAVGAYTAVRQDAFLTSYNLRNLLLATMPLALVALGQTCALLVGGFDVSVGALLTFCVVARLVHDDADDLDLGADPGRARAGRRGPRRRCSSTRCSSGSFACPRSSPRSARTAILTGASLWLRDHPSGPISSNAIDELTTSWSFVPLAFIGVIALALAGDFWLYRTRSGHGAACGRPRRDVLAPDRDQDQLGRDPRVRRLLRAGVDRRLLPRRGGPDRQPDPSATSRSKASPPACSAGASLAGGRGSFFGTLLAALFLTEIDNVLPLFHQPTEYAEMTIGVLILVALVLYQAPELLERLRSARLSVGRLRTRQGEAPAG